MTKSKQKLYGILAQFETVPEIYQACEKVRDRGFLKWEAYSPFPIHGINKAMGLAQSKLAWIVLIVASFFGIGSFLLWTWMNASDYKYIIAGKPFYSWPAYFLPAFECTVLSAAMACLVGMLFLNKLPRCHHSLFQSKAFMKVTNDKFFISIEAIDPKFDLSKTPELLKQLGASHIELVDY